VPLNPVFPFFQDDLPLLEPDKVLVIVIGLGSSFLETTAALSSSSKERSLLPD